MKMNELESKILRNKVFGDSENKIIVVDGYIFNKRETATIAADVETIRVFKKDGDVFTTSNDEEKISSYYNEKDYDVFEIQTGEVNKKYSNRSNVNDTIEFKITKSDISIKINTSDLVNVDMYRTFRRMVVNTIEEESVYTFNEEKVDKNGMEKMYFTIISNNEEKIARVILHSKKSSTHILNIYTNPSKYFGEIYFDSIDYKFDSVMNIDQTNIDNSNLKYNAEFTTEKVRLIDETVVTDDSKEVVKYENHDIGIGWERVPYEGPIKGPFEENSYTEKYYFGKKFGVDVPFITIHTCFGKNNSFFFTDSSINGYSYQYTMNGYIYNEKCNIFGDLETSRFNPKTNQTEYRKEREGGVKRALISDDKSEIKFLDLDERWVVELNTDKVFLESEYGFNYTNIFKGKIYFKNNNGKKILIANFSVNNNDKTIEFSFIQDLVYSAWDTISYYKNDKFGGFEYVQNVSNRHLNNGYIKISCENCRDHMHYRDNVQEFMIGSGANIRGYKSEIYDPELDDIYMRGIFGIPYLFHKVVEEEKEC